MAFDPTPHIRTFTHRVKNKDGRGYTTVKTDYLDVKWRVVWFRESHPEATIITDLLSEPGTSPAVVRATVTIPQPEGTPNIVATGWGQIAESKWRDYLEKAETRAIGRALALLGFGTQFVEADEDPVDSSVESSAADESDDDLERISPTMIAELQKVAGMAGLEEGALKQLIHDNLGVNSLEGLSADEARRLWVHLDKRIKGQEDAGAADNAG